jgi:LETM1 and EF-hand domain-containing protein 1
MISLARHNYKKILSRSNVTSLTIQNFSSRQKKYNVLVRQYHRTLISFDLNSENDKKSKDSVDKTNKLVSQKLELDETNSTKLPFKTKVINGARYVYASTVDIIKNPGKTWKAIKDEAHHYWVGTKLLWVEMKMAGQIIQRLLSGHGMTRRERMQLIRTTTDMLRLVPFAVFVIVPFMELLLPFALKLFPNMLPSTFQDNLKKEESMKRELQMRLAVAGFMQETLQEMAKKQQQTADKDDTSGKELISFIEKARLGEPISNDSVIKIARLFKDELTLANIARPQLVTMCRYMKLQPFGADSFLRFQLRTKLRSIKEDDRRILWEGINTLTTLELREACQERGMRSIGLTSFGYKHQLQEWLDLSIQKNIPISLLIMSRAISLSSTSRNPEDVLKNSMSSLDADTINEIVLAVASPGEQNTIDMKTRKLESIQFQKELIEDEREEKEDAKASAKTTKTIEEKAKSADADIKTDTTNIPVGDQTSKTDNVGNIKNEEVAIKDSTIKTVEIQSELSVEEIQAIGDLTRGSSVEREKAELAKLEASIDAVIVGTSQVSSASVLATLPESKSEVSKPTDTSKEDEKIVKSKETVNASKQEEKSIINMKSALNQMLDKLKVKIDTTEKAVGDKLKLLDIDNDGELSSEELKVAILKSLKRTPTEKEVEEIVKLLDSDQDGKVKVLELMQYVESRRDKKEVEVLEAQLKSQIEDKKKDDSTKS